MPAPHFNLIEFDQLPSTNRYVLEHLTQLHHGDVVLARIQTAGRGRFQRTWISHHPDNVSISILLKPAPALTPILPATTHYLAVVLSQTLESEGIVVNIKWPNDVLVDDRKIAGILAEARMEGERLAGMALGLGVNLNLSEEDLANIDQPATALNLLLNRSVDRDSFVRQLLDRFFAGLDDFFTGGFDSIRHEYQRRALFLGQPITVRQPIAHWTGIARGLDPTGALQLETADGTIKHLHAGDTLAAPR